VRARISIRPPFVAVGLASCWLSACALADTGTNTSIQSGGTEANPYGSQGGTGSTAPRANGGESPTGGATLIGTGAVPSGGTTTTCGNGTIDAGEACDLERGLAPVRGFCIDCQIDTDTLISVTGLANPPSLVDDDGRLHYYFTTEATTYNSAATTCFLSGAYPMVIRSDAELAIANTLLANWGQGWVGARDFGTYNAWYPHWVTDEPWDYLPAGGYRADTPNDTCIVFDVTTQALDDRSCLDSYRVTCEWPVPGSL
jgi:hypothetical protein